MQTLDELNSRRPQRSLAWIWYALLTVGALIVGVSQPVFFLVAIALAAYARYLYRGGSIVVWFW
jgi:hypothetical protein